MKDDQTQLGLHFLNVNMLLSCRGNGLNAHLTMAEPWELQEVCKDQSISTHSLEENNKDYRN